MSHGHIIKNSKIYNERTGALIQDATPVSGKYKYYALLVKCGHVGTEYFMPVVFSVIANNKEEAIALTKNTPRVKRDLKDWLLAIKEISSTEYFFISYINDHDPYLNQSSLNENNDMICRRRVVSPESLEFYMNGAKTYQQDKSRDKNINNLNLDIRTANDYSPTATLQRTTAPLLEGSKFKYRRFYNLNEILPLYYKEQAIRLGILKKVATPLTFYYQIMGGNNDLGITYSNGKIYYKDAKLNMAFDVHEDMRKYMDNALTSEPLYPSPNEDYRQKQRALLDYYEPEEDEKRESQIDKFNKRYKRYLEIKAKKDEPTGLGQPGE